MRPFEWTAKEDAKLAEAHAKCATPTGPSAVGRSARPPRNFVPLALLLQVWWALGQDCEGIAGSVRGRSPATVGYGVEVVATSAEGRAQAGGDARARRQTRAIACGDNRPDAIAEACHFILSGRLFSPRQLDASTTNAHTRAHDRNWHRHTSVGTLLPMPSWRHRPSATVMLCSSPRNVEPPGRRTMKTSWRCAATTRTISCLGNPCGNQWR